MKRMLAPSPSLRRLAHPAEARLTVQIGEREEVVLGQYQRGASALNLDEVARLGLTVSRRVSGGPAVLFGPGSLHVALSLPRADALVACTPAQLVNRHVRPLLRALSRLGLSAHYFGRDWVSAGKRPVAWVGHAELANGACWVEVLLGVCHPFALPPELDGYRASRSEAWFLGKAPSTLEEVLGRRLSVEEVREGIVEAYHGAFGEIAPGGWSPEEIRPEARDSRPPWDATAEVAIGFVGASAGPSPEVGGDIIACTDVIEALSRAMTELGPMPSEEQIAAALCEALKLGTVVGVKDNATIARVMLAAFRARSIES